MATIPADIIERIRQATDIVSLINRTTPLDGLRGACVFHQDDRHDLVVDPVRRRFHCVGCWATGDVLDFESRTHRRTYVRALWGLANTQELATSLGNVVYRLPTDAVREREPTHVGLGMPAFRITRGSELLDVRVCPWPVVKIGRLPTSHLVLDDPKIARMHAVIEVTDRISLNDLAGPAGTHVNGTRIETQTELHVRDVVAFGDVKLEFIEIVQPQTPNLAHEAALAEARMFLTLAEQAVVQQQLTDARVLLRAARARVRDPGLQRVREQLDDHTSVAWPADEEGVACWLDDAGLARLTALSRALQRFAASDDEPLSEAMERAVLHDPDEDSPRLVYADWLQQRGDPRGEFIALSIAEFRGTLDIGGRWRQQELLDAHGARWAAEFTSHGAEVEFRRGFPAIVRYSGLWSRALIGLVRHWTTVYRVEGPLVPDVLANLT